MGFRRASCPECRCRSPEDLEAIVGEREKATVSDRILLPRCRTVIITVVDNLGPPALFMPAW